MSVVHSIASIKSESYIALKTGIFGSVENYGDLIKQWIYCIAAFCRHTFVTSLLWLCIYLFPKLLLRPHFLTSFATNCVINCYIYTQRHALSIYGKSKFLWGRAQLLPRPLSLWRLWRLTPVAFGTLTLASQLFNPGATSAIHVLTLTLAHLLNIYYDIVNSVWNILFLLVVRLDCVC